MRRDGLHRLSVEELVERFAAFAVDRDEAILDDDIAKSSRLFWKLDAVEKELKARLGDQRTALCQLYAHRNLQVRLDAAKATLAVAPKAARDALQSIQNAREYPQSGDAGMCLWALDEGIFKPT